MEPVPAAAAVVVGAAVVAAADGELPSAVVARLLHSVVPAAIVQLDTGLVAADSSACTHCRIHNTECA